MTFVGSAAHQAAIKKRDARMDAAHALCKAEKAAADAKCKKEISKAFDEFEVWMDRHINRKAG